MKRTPAAEISDAVLYEGYLLYPYRDSAIKNQYRWTFGCLFPKTWCQQYEPSEKDHLHSEFLITGTPEAEFDVRLRCLVLPPANQEGSDAKPVERQVVVTGIRPAEYIDGQRAETFCLLAETSTTSPSLQHPSGVVGNPKRQRGTSCDLTQSLADASGYQIQSDVTYDLESAIKGQLTIESTEVQRDVLRISIEVRNVTQSIDVKTRDQAAHQALLSTQLTLSCRNAEFVSLIDPPDELRVAASECRNDGWWPVLAGLPGTHDHLLIAPIILYDYPQVAPESSGDMFDGTEIDEILTMRIRTLTGDEKAEMANSDPRAHDLLQRAEAMPDKELSKMHGVMRASSTVPQSAEEDIAPKSLRVDGIELRPGDQVRLHPKGRNDIFDLALAGKAATIETIERDFEDQHYFTVTIDCDPGRDFGQMGLPGHRFYFRTDEVEPLVRGRSVKT